MRLLIDIDEIVFNVTQSLKVDYFNKVRGKKEIFKLHESIVNIESLDIELIAYFEKSYASILPRLRAYSEMILINSFEWDCIFRTPTKDIISDSKSEIAKDLLDALDLQGIKRPTRTIECPIDFKNYETSVVRDTIINQNYILFTTSKYLTDLALQSELVNYIMFISRVYNLEYSKEHLNDSKVIVCSDFLSSIQTYASIINLEEKLL